MIAGKIMSGKLYTKLLNIFIKIYIYIQYCIYFYHFLYSQSGLLNILIVWLDGFIFYYFNPSSNFILKKFSFKHNIYYTNTELLSKKSTAGLEWRRNWITCDTL